MKVHTVSCLQYVAWHQMHISFLFLYVNNYACIYFIFMKWLMIASNIVQSDWIIHKEIEVHSERL